MNIPQAGIFLITGIMAAGKSTVAQRLAERLPRSVHVRGDLFRRMIVSGRFEMEADYDDRAYAQLLLRYELAALVSRRYSAAGFVAVYQDIIIGPELQQVADMLRHDQPVYVVVLCPAPEVVAQREAARGKVGYRTWSPTELDQELRANTPKIGLWLDTSALSVDETVDAILARQAEARIHPAAPDSSLDVP